MAFPIKTPVSDKQCWVFCSQNPLNHASSWTKKITILICLKRKTIRETTKWFFTHHFIMLLYFGVQESTINESSYVTFNSQPFNVLSGYQQSILWIRYSWSNYDNKTFDPTGEVDGVVSFLYWIHYDNGTSDIFH